MSPRQQVIKNGDKFYEGRPCKEGHTKRYAKDCGCVECSKEKFQEFYRNNREEVDERNRQYALDNKENKSEYDRQYNQRPEVKKRINKLWKERYNEDEVFKVKKLLQSQLRHFCNSVNGKKKGRTEELLGYPVKELRDHLESLFKDGMTWENQGKWHIDHRIPQSFFTSIDQIPECFALKNLKPEWGEWNMSKGNRFIG